MKSAHSSSNDLPAAITGQGSGDDGEWFLSRWTHKRAMLATIPCLTLGILGGAVLPVAWAFSLTGVVAGFVIQFVVALSNSYTSDLLLRQAYKSGNNDYETLAYSVGGPIWKMVTDISIIVLLLGTIVGGILQVGEAGATALTSIWPDTVPDWVIAPDGSGRVIMVAATVLVVAPLCLIKEIRQLEYAAVGGFIIVLWLTVVVVMDSIRAGLPAYKSGDLPKAGFSDSLLEAHESHHVLKFGQFQQPTDGLAYIAPSLDIARKLAGVHGLSAGVERHPAFNRTLGNVCQSISSFGFAYYIQPVMMPMLAEMPPGKNGVKVLAWSTRIVICVIAFVVYSLIGFFGAALYGTDTEGNILQNTWMGGGVPQGILNIAMCLFLALSIPPIQFPTRRALQHWIPGDHQKFRWLRHIGTTTVILGFCLGMALLFPNSSAKVLLVTGATGVCMVSYVIPVVNHFVMYFNWAKCQRETLAVAESSVRSQFGGHPVIKVIQEQAVDLKDALPPYADDGEASPDVLTYRPTRAHSFVGYLQAGVIDFLIPALVVAVGIFTSVAALSTINTV